MDSEEIFRARLDEAAEGLEIVSLEKSLPAETSIQNLRRAHRSVMDDSIGIMTLVKRNEVLHWEHNPGIIPRGMSGRRALAQRGTVRKQMKYKRLGASQVGQFLETLDRKLNSRDGLYRWTDGAFQQCAQPSGERPVLLFVHGTFSSGERILADFRTNHGRDFMRRMAERYEVLTFEHPTLSVSPILNALRLARLLARFPHPIDIVSHSRGGLVVRWWIEVFDPAPLPSRRAILVGAPLGGTSLAAPDKLRHGIDLFTNLGEMFGDTAQLIPFLTAAMGLLKVVLSLGHVVAHTPLIDVGLAAVPGLAAMSRIANNFEHQYLNEPGSGSPQREYFAVTSNFEPPPTGWKFWRGFADYKTRLANLATDHLIFDGKNDLVVDTDSMIELPSALAATSDGRQRVLSLDTSQVHHTTYFQDERTVKFLDEVLLNA